MEKFKDKHIDFEIVNYRDTVKKLGKEELKNQIKELLEELPEPLKDTNFSRKVIMWAEDSYNDDWYVMEWLMDNDVTLFALNNYRVLGYLVASSEKVSLDHNIEEISTIDFIIVREQLRKEGIGRKLVEKSLSILNRPVIIETWISYKDINRSPVEFWYKMGFSEITLDELRRYYPIRILEDWVDKMSIFGGKIELIKDYYSHRYNGKIMIKRE